MAIETLMQEKETASKYNPLGHLDGLNLTGKQKDLLYDLDNFEAPYLEERLLSDGKLKNSEEYREVFIEFKKYVALNKISGKKMMTMLSDQVDEVWHQFILFTPQYHEFCNETLGEYFHHQPWSKSVAESYREEGSKNLIESYKEVFGEVPEIWERKSKSENSDCARYCDNVPPPCCKVDA